MRHDRPQRLSTSVRQVWDHRARHCIAVALPWRCRFDSRRSRFHDDLERLPITGRCRLNRLIEPLTRSTPWSTRAPRSLRGSCRITLIAPRVLGGLRPNTNRWHYNQTFERRSRIVFAHDPEPGQRERAGADGVYELVEVDTSATRLSIDITVWVELPLPSFARGAVERVMAMTMQRAGDRFASGLCTGVSASTRAGYRRRRATSFVPGDFG